jgi:hypothetical protein
VRDCGMSRTVMTCESNLGGPSGAVASCQCEVVVIDSVPRSANDSTDAAVFEGGPWIALPLQPLSSEHAERRARLREAKVIFVEPSDVRCHLSFVWICQSCTIIFSSNLHCHAAESASTYHSIRRHRSIRGESGCGCFLLAL